MKTVLTDSMHMFFVREMDPARRRRYIWGWEGGGGCCTTLQHKPACHCKALNFPGKPVSHSSDKFFDSDPCKTLQLSQANTLRGQYVLSAVAVSQCVVINIVTSVDVSRLISLRRARRAFADGRRSRRRRAVTAAAALRQDKRTNDSN